MPDFKIDIRARLAELGLSPVREEEIVEELSQRLEANTSGRSVAVPAKTKRANKSLEQLNTPDFLGRELRNVERRAPKMRSHWERKGSPT